jgi:hypothetical protein
MKNLLASIFICVHLSGCVWNAKPDIPVITPKVVHIDARAYERCEPLRPLSNPDELLQISLANMEIYSQCVRKQDNSIKLLKEFANYKEPK